MSEKKFECFVFFYLGFLFFLFPFPTRWSRGQRRFSSVACLLQLRWRTSRTTSSSLERWDDTQLARFYAYAPDITWNLSESIL
jgi:hypothetical protein